jgi:2-dehydro-3-deoxygluconokinase
MKKVVCFGEIMLRLSPPGFERFLQSPKFSATFGGGEANVAVSLARFGHESHYVTRLPAHAIGEAVLKSLRAEGVRVEHIERGGDRVGIYFAETGASQRGGVVIYDRAHSAIADLEPQSVRWPVLFAGAHWFHTTGITPALGPKPATCVKEALATAKSLGLLVSFDLNYRAKLWTPEQAQAVVKPLMSNVDVLIANEEDMQKVLGVEVEDVDVQGGKVEAERYRPVAERVSREFGPALVAITLRESKSASENGWSAALYDRHANAFHVSRSYDVTLVDRIGGGDSFAAGLIHGLLAGRLPDQALEFAVAASALKQTIPGDFNRVSATEVERLLQGDGSGRVAR